MAISPAFPGFIEHGYRSTARAMVDAYGDSDAPPEAPPRLGNNYPALLLEAMGQAFTDQMEMLADDAPGFFREGMERMDALDYPQPVRRVMKRYFQLWCTPKTLH